MDKTDFLSLPRQRTPFVPEHQRHKILPPGVYRGDGCDTAFHNRRRVPDGLPPDALLTDCMAEVLRRNGPMSAGDVAKALNACAADVQLMMSRMPHRFVKMRESGERSVLWSLAPEDDNPELIGRVVEFLRANDATIRQIAFAVNEPDSKIRLLLRRNEHLFIKTGKAGKSNAAGTLWGVTR